jgi:hypothetical protein
VRPAPSTTRILRSTNRPKKTVPAENKNTLSNKRENTLNEGRVCSRVVADSDSVDGSEMSDVRRYTACERHHGLQPAAINVREAGLKLTMSWARNRSMNEALTPAEVALKICNEVGWSVRVANWQSEQHKLTLLTLKSTLRMLARMMLPIATSPISRDQAAISSSTLSTSASLERSEVMRSGPVAGAAGVEPSTSARSGVGIGGWPRE